MLKNKYAQYILAPLLLIVWGTIFYKIYIAMSGNTGDFMPTNPSFQLLAEAKGEEESFELLLNYKDPFLGKKFAVAGNHQENNYSSRNYQASPMPPSNPTSNKAGSTKPNNGKQPDTKGSIAINDMPNVIYQGCQIFQEDTVALLKINKHFYANARKGEILEDVLIEAIFRDSLHIYFEGQRQTIKRQKKF